MTPATAVVHLVWVPAGPAPFEQFIASYERHEAQLEHDLVLLFNGFDQLDDLAAYRRRAAGLAAREIVLPARSLDLPAYLAAARELPHGRVCFVNSYTQLLARGWLRMLVAPLADPAIGAAGATGSWASHRSFALSLLRLPNGYHGTLGDRRLMHPALRAVSTAPKAGIGRRIARAAAGLPGEITAYPGFPAPHLRTNAFAIGRELLLSLQTGPLDTKQATYRFEAGRAGMTTQLLERALEVAVVSRDGVARTHASWPDADVFWQGAQDQLLVADNQTRQYEAGGPAVREALSRYAWGPRARPG